MTLKIISAQEQREGRLQKRERSRSASESAQQKASGSSGSPQKCLAFGLVSRATPFISRGRVWSNSHHDFVPVCHYFLGMLTTNQVGANKRDAARRIECRRRPRRNDAFYVTIYRSHLELLFAPTYAHTNCTVGGTKS